MRRAGLDSQAQDAQRIKRFSGLRLNYLYSLYDALVSINVPSDKARAVVDAMERDMGSTLATKQDLEFHTLATKKDIEILRRDVEGRIEFLKQDIETRIEILKQDMLGRIENLKQDMERRFEVLGQGIEARFARVDERFDSLELRMTVKLGSMLAVCFGLTIAALRFWH